MVTRAGIRGLASGGELVGVGGCLDVVAEDPAAEVSHGPRVGSIFMRILGGVARKG
jgi:hypothetical protein